jgi:hypothetical protein
MSGNPYYSGNPFASALDGIREGWKSQDEQEIQRAKIAQMQAEAANQQALRAESAQRVAIAQAKQDAEQAAAERLGAVQTQFANRMAPTRQQLFAPGGDTGPSNELSAYGRQMQQGLLSGTPQTITQPVDGVMRDMADAGLADPSQWKPAAGWHAPMALQETYDLPNPAYAAKQAEIQQAMQQQGHVMRNAAPLTPMEALQYGAADPSIVPALKEYRAEQPKPDNLPLLEAAKLYTPESIEKWKTTGKLSDLENLDKNKDNFGTWQAGDMMGVFNKKDGTKGWEQKVGVNPSTVFKIDNRQAAPTMPDDAIRLEGIKFATTGKMSALGNGNGALKVKIMAAGAQYLKEQGIDPASVPGMQAEYASTAKAFSALQTPIKQLKGFEAGMIKNADYALSLAKPYGNTNFPAANHIINAIKTNKGDDDVVKLAAAISAFSLEYEKVKTAGTNITSAELSIGAQKRAEEIANKAQSYKQLAGVIEVMKTDTHNITGSRQKELDQVHSELNGIGKLYGQPAPTSNMPKIGEVRNGYMYMGGDPSDRKSWGKR